MKKLYNKKGKIHPSPPIISDHLAFLPATIFTLTAALSPEDREVLAYLISCSGSPANFSGTAKKGTAQKSYGAGGGAGGGWSMGGSSDHPPLFNCDCFRCYTSYWVRWDASPNRQLIHDIIDAFEDELSKTKKGKNKKERKKKGFGTGSSESSSSSSVEVMAAAAPVEERGGGTAAGGGGDGRDVDADQVGNGEARRDHDHHHDDDDHEEEIEKGSSVKSFVSFIGEKIWGVWG